NLVDALVDALLLPGVTPGAQPAKGDKGRGKWTGLGGRSIARGSPVIEVVLEAQEILDDRAGRFVRLPAAPFERQQGVPGSIRLPTLALALAVILAVRFQKGSDVFDLLFDILAANVKTTLARSCEG